MTINSEHIQALRAAAEKAIADDWGYDRDEFSEIASPEAILSLLAERDADKALIAELKYDVDAANARVDAGCAQLCKQDDTIATLHDACSQWERKAISNFEECAEMSARIEELEGALNLASASYAGERERADALQARTLTVKLTKPHAHLIWIQAGHGPDDYWDDVAVSHSVEDRCCDGSERYPVYSVFEIQEACASAGITLVVGE